MNRWNIPAGLEQEVRQRDKSCVYCGIVFGGVNRPSWEHIVNDARIVTRENIALCCRPCNSSKGVKPLEVWLWSAYCKQHVAVEKVHFSQNSRNLGDRKCLPEPRRSFIGHPSAKFFRPFSSEGVFQQPRPIVRGWERACQTHKQEGGRFWLPSASSQTGE